MAREITVIKKVDISGEIVSEFQEVATSVSKLTRTEIVGIIAELTSNLALYQKLLVDTDATAVSLTP